MPPKNTAVRTTPKKKKPAPTISKYASMFTSAIRRVSQWHPLMKQVLKNANYECEECGKSKKDGAKLEVHHREPVAVYREMKKLAERMFPPIELLDCLCTECHKEITKREKE